MIGIIVGLFGLLVSSPRWGPSIAGKPDPTILHMNPTTNPATRVYRIIDAATALRVNDKTPSVVAWKMVLGLPADPEDDAGDLREHEMVFPLLVAAHQEAERIFELAATIEGFNVDPFKSLRQQLRTILHPRHIFSPWEAKRRQLVAFQEKEYPTHLYGLEMALRGNGKGEEEQAPDELLEGIVEQIAALEERLGDGALGPALRAFLADQVKRMYVAIAQYRISGVRGMQDEVLSGFGRAAIGTQLIEQSLDLEDPESAVTLLQRVTGIWQRMAGVVDSVDKVEKMLSMGAKLAGYLQAYTPPL